MSASPGSLIIPPEENAVSDDPTRQISDPRSFEERVFARFDSLDERIGRLETKVDTLDGRLTALEEKVDSRLRETRPIWEAMQIRLESIEKEAKAARRGVTLLHEDNLSIRGDLRELVERVEKLESQSAR
ncbi:MAG TPA: hypothetical protein VF736_16805 [Pyrinomonadaceae bacterium]